jgi:hypothetical protein
MIIGIAGHARHGKDTTADFIVGHFGYRKQALADVMKEAMRVVFGWDDRYLYGDLKDKVDPRFGISPRHALQSFGTQWGQWELSKYDSFSEVTGRKLWVNSLLSRVSGDIVISDVRFPHEADAIHERGGIVILIRRSWYPIDMTHESEQSVEEIRPDFVIRNGSTLEALEEETVSLMNEILNRK